MKSRVVFVIASSELLEYFNMYIATSSVKEDYLDFKFIKHTHTV